MAIDPKKVKRLKRLMEMTDSFTQIVAVEKKLNERLDERIRTESEEFNELMTEFREVLDNAKSEMSKEFGGIRQKTKEAIDRLFARNDVNQKLNLKLDEADEIMTNLSRKFATIRDGKDGKDGKNGKDGKDGAKGDKGDPGKDGESFDAAEFDKLREEAFEYMAEELRKIRRRGGGGTSALGVQQAMKWFGPGQVITITANKTIDKETGAVLADATSGGITVTLPPVAHAKGREYHIKKIDTSANTVTIATPGSETIDGESTKVIQSSYTSRRIYSNGTNYYII